jgi:hypothetical protein
MQKVSRIGRDKTIEKNYIQKWQFLIAEYLLTKKGNHPKFRFVSDFYRSHNTNRQTFCKYYNRYLNSGVDKDLLPRKRGPKWQSRIPSAEIESQVLLERKKGLNKYEICLILKPKLGSNTPSPSGVYNICKRAGLNQLNHKMKEEKQKIIKTFAGELGHIDCHYLSKDLITSKQRKRYYLVGIIDDYSRIVWAEAVEDIKSLTVMFSTLKSINMINQTYAIQFQEILSDNGSEFSSRSDKSKDSHPFERMLIELGIKHRYTKPYRPQTNGKIERFWRTLNEDLIEGTCFDSIDHYRDELTKYLFYYNQMRPHQSLNGLTPEQFLKKESNDS